MRYVIDTNIFLEAFVRTDSVHHAYCGEFIKSLAEGQLKATVPGIVLAEIGWTLQSYYKVPRREVAEVLQSLLALKPLQVVDSYRYLAAIQAYAKNGVKYIDACIASMPLFQTKNAAIVSYDTDFDTLGIKRVTPEDLL